MSHSKPPDAQTTRLSRGRVTREAREESHRVFIARFCRPDSGIESAARARLSTLRGRPYGEGQIRGSPSIRHKKQ